ncbi:MAG: helix-turn-helix transcriptional regulator [Synechococcales cyanobacterium C42_A2020_086]|jgi:DNA-binding PadR family transcriptional regulator|nr:helix-turn-helix transcriptional regulator [Synechococcales cyanobacterium C42_A2020_086]
MADKGRNEETTNGENSKLNLSLLEASILKVLKTAHINHPEGLSGYVIGQGINSASKDAGKRETGVGALYPALERLEKLKLIEGRFDPKDEGKKIRPYYYKITGAGFSALESAEKYWSLLESHAANLGSDGRKHPRRQPKARRRTEPSTLADFVYLPTNLS